MLIQSVPRLSRSLSAVTSLRSFTAATVCADSLSCSLLLSQCRFPPINRFPVTSAVRSFHYARPCLLSSEEDDAALLHWASSSPSLSPGRESDLASRLRISDILKASPSNPRFSCPEHYTVGEAVSFLCSEKLSSALVTAADGSVAGIFTARDLLQFIKDHYVHHSHSRSLADQLSSTRISEVMTKRDKMVYCSPSDTVAHCREIMFQCKIRNMPVLDAHGEIHGLITMKVLADSAFDLMETGGKKGFIHNVTGRRGLPANARVSPSLSRASLSSSNAANDTYLDLEVGVFALPHPYKKATGVALNRRDYGADELSYDLSLCEDAHFALRLRDPCPAPNAFAPSDDELNAQTNSESVVLPSLAVRPEDPPSQVYLCVADGVGSWRTYGVDPRQYSHRLVTHAREVVEADFAHRHLLGSGPFAQAVLSGDGSASVHPLNVIHEAWASTTLDEVVGSSTICVATLDRKLGQLAYSNIGDGGLVVLRRTDARPLSSSPLVLGSLNERERDRESKSRVKVAYLSQQQLKGFNLPFQLGFTNIPDTPAGFESPSDADTASVPVSPGDIVVMATDGLFDNMDLTEIADVVDQWQSQYFGGREKDDLRLPSAKGAEAVQALATKLVRTARELSLDKMRDSPFALLAKENDIMWGGGMPDDTTVIVARVVSVTKKSETAKK